ncbi:MAG: biotin--[acetyl-CoA-carboxylase] ligase [Cyanobacteria bacterium]|nr:biotin--[acetyl-CoA-carboxylase] ligase [Cyanobacteriota bacterium]
MSWKLRRLPVCASTEIELDRWLEQRQASDQPLQRLAVTARRQRFGHGQQGRPWLSPSGGLWLSAAIPWAEALPGTACLGLAVAVGISQQLDALGLAVQIKWPNDLLVGDRKIAGLLPRMRLRGQRIRAAQVGVGLNGCNRVPPGALSVAEALGCRQGHPLARPERLLPRVLAGLEWAAAHAQQPCQVRTYAEARLWCPPTGWLHEGELWQVLGLHVDGRLRLNRPGRELALQRNF